MRLFSTSRDPPAVLRRGDAARAHLPAGLDAGHPGPGRAVGRRRHRDRRRDLAQGRQLPGGLPAARGGRPRPAHLLRRGRAGVVREGGREQADHASGCSRAGPRPTGSRARSTARRRTSSAVADRDRARRRSVVGQGRPPPADRADARPRPLEPAAPTRPGSLERRPTRTSTRPSAPCCRPTTPRSSLDLGERRVVVALDGHPNPVQVGSPARARGPSSADRIRACTHERPIAS